MVIIIKKYTYLSSHLAVDTYCTIILNTIPFKSFMLVRIFNVFCDQYFQK